MMSRKTYAGALALFAACVADPDLDFDEDLGDDVEEFRGAQLCMDPVANECRFDLLGAACDPHEIDPCLDPWQPRVCTAPGAACIVIHTGESCPTGWSDACQAFGP
jgi:hypothetical protein